MARRIVAPKRSLWNRFQRWLGMPIPPSLLAKAQANLAQRKPGYIAGLMLDMNGKVPRVSPTAWIAPAASLSGDVTIGDKTSVWFGAVLRGDVNSITVGNDTVIGDRVTVHVSKNNPSGPAPTVIGNNVYVGPGALLHACNIGDGASVAAGAIVQDGAVLEPGSAVGPGSIVPVGRRVPAGEYWTGAPAKFERDWTPSDVETTAQRLAQQAVLAAYHVDEIQKSAEEMEVEAIMADLYEEEGAKKEDDFHF